MPEQHPDHLLFLHIPKAAGITMLGILFRQYAEAERFGTKGLWQGNADFNALPDAEKHAIKLLYGHFPFGYHEQLGGGTSEYFTLLRDPVERVLSAYSDILETKDHYLHQEFVTSRSSFADLHTRGNWPALDNCQVRMLSGYVMAPYGSIGEQHLQQAMHNIETYFPVAGVQHYFDECLLELTERYGWKKPWYRKRHVTARRINQQDLPPSEIHVIRSANTFDQQLFDFVWRRCDAHYKALGEPFRKKLANFQQRNNLLGKMMNIFSPLDPES